MEVIYKKMALTSFDIIIRRLLIWCKNEKHRTYRKLSFLNRDPYNEIEEYPLYNIDFVKESWQKVKERIKLDPNGSLKEALNDLLE